MLTNSVKEAPDAPQPITALRARADGKTSVFHAENAGRRLEP